MVAARTKPKTGTRLICSSAMKLPAMDARFRRRTTPIPCQPHWQFMDNWEECANGNAPRKKSYAEAARYISI